MAFLDQPITLGRKAVVRYSESSVAFPHTLGFIDQTQIDAWLNASDQTREVRSVSLAVKTAYAEMTPRPQTILVPAQQFASQPVLVQTPIARQISVQFSSPHYDESVPTDSGVERFPKWIMKRAMAGDETGLMFLENDSDPSSGYFGNFHLSPSKQEDIRGIQWWAYTATSTGLFQFAISLDMTPP